QLDPTRTCAIYATSMPRPTDRATTYALAIRVDGSGHAWVAGATRSLDCPTINQLQPATVDRGSNSTTSEDAFVTKMSATGVPVDFSTTFGGSGDDEGRALALW